jgi:hypothetical protein
MDSTALQRLASDPAEFRRHLVIDADGGPRRLAETMNDWQREDFEALDAGWRRVVGLPADGAKQRAYLERPRGHSKTGDLAVMVTWALFAARRQIAGVAAAADKDQGRLLRDAVAKLVSLNTWLAGLLDVQAYRVVNVRTGSDLQILSCDAPSSYGLTPSFAVVDELTHHRSEELWVSILSAAAKRSDCMLVVISNAGTGQGESWQWKIREAARADDGWYFHSLDGCRASWISPKHLAEQRRLLPAIQFDRLWANRWTSGSGDALLEDDITAAVTRKKPWTKPKRGWIFTAGLDVGLSKDSCALVAVGKSIGEQWLVGMGDTEKVSRVRATGRLRLGSVVLWKPERGRRVSLKDVERSVLRLHEHYGLASLAYDPFQCELLAERLSSEGVPCERVPFTPANLQTMASTMLDTFTARMIDLFPHERLLSDLRNLKLAERTYGVRLTSPRGPHGHGDLATSLALALFASREFSEGDIGEQFIDHPLVY